MILVTLGFKNMDYPFLGMKVGRSCTDPRLSRKGRVCTKRIFASPLTARQVRNYSPGNMEQASSRGHEASPKSGLDVGCRRCSSSKKLRGLSVRAQARRISIPLSFSVDFFPRSCLPRAARRGAARGSAIQGLARSSLDIQRPRCS